MATQKETKPKAALSKVSDNSANGGNSTNANKQNGLDGQLDHARPRRPSVDIGLDMTAETCVLLTQVVSNQGVLYVKTRNYHWNVVGPNFHSLHEVFEKQYKMLEKAQDETAERIRQLGHRAQGSLHQFIEGATLRDEERDNLDADTMVRSLLADHEECIRGLRDMVDTIEVDHEDVGTADFLNALMQKHEMMAWMLRALANLG